MSDESTNDTAEPSPASAGSPPLRLFVCSRWSYDDPERYQSWYGALLILAADEKSARDLFVKTEWNHEQPRMVEPIPGVFVDEAREWLARSRAVRPLPSERIIAGLLERVTLTDEEREAIEWASRAEWGSNPHAATLRSLLARLGGGE